MTPAEAQAKLQRMTDYATAPALTADDIADCLAMSAIVDSSGLVPTDASWTPTYDLNRGAAEGWRRKASRAAVLFNFSTDGQSFERSQIATACERIAKEYAKKIVGSVPVTGTLARSDD